MNKKTSLLILILLLVIAFIVGIKKNILFKDFKSRTKKTRLLFPELKIEEVNLIEITKDDQKTVITKKEDQWQRKEATVSAQKDKVEAVLETIKKLEKRELVSLNPAKRKIFNVDKNGVHVVLKKGDQGLADFWVGKRGADFLSTYVRKEGDNEVWVVDQVLSTIFLPASLEK